jgi:hypothetical protein
MKSLHFFLLICFVSNTLCFAQLNYPLFKQAEETAVNDWLLSQADMPAKLYKTERNELVFANGLVSRTFTIEPNCATIGLEHLQTNESFLRSVRPEAEIEINGITFEVGGINGQPIHNYLLPEWIKEMKANPTAFKLLNYKIEETKERFQWKKREKWMPRDMPWPIPGKELIFSYKLDDKAIGLLIDQRASDAERGNLFTDTLQTPDNSWHRFESNKGDRNSFMNEGKFEDYKYLEDIVVNVHYELYDGLPVFCKWITVENNSCQEIRINSFKSEILAVTEPESVVDHVKNWTLPNITVESDYNFGGMSSENILNSSVAWKEDPLYLTQVNYERKTPCLLEVYPKYGPDQLIKPNTIFNSYRVWELFHDSWDRERKGLERRRMMRTLAPWVTENPILMHVRSSDDDAVKKAIDQCAEVGFEMVIMTFGSGFNAEDNSINNIERMKALTEYAHSKEIALGGYSLLASRSIDNENNVVMPEGMTPRFGNSPCLESEWGHDYFDKLYQLYEKSNLDVLEHDGSYPGDVCASTKHPGHEGLNDSQWNQYKRISEFYQWCRSKGIYLNVPDYYFLAGSNKTGMGYRETNWSLPREQQEIIERQNIYDGTWSKTPSMGWMFVPLVQYHGGGAAATIEPLKEHLPHYAQRLSNLFGAGVQACYRGPQLYDAPETKILVEKWVNFYKKHRQVLDGDIIHLRRPDGRDWDGILHVNPDGEEKGLIMLYNPLESVITREINIPVYYTGLHEKVLLEDNMGNRQNLTVNRDYEITINVTIPEKGYKFFVLK